LKKLNQTPIKRNKGFQFDAFREDHDDAMLTMVTTSQIFVLEWSLATKLSLLKHKDFGILLMKAELVGVIAVPNGAALHKKRKKML